MELQPNSQKWKRNFKLRGLKYNLLSVGTAQVVSDAQHPPTVRLPVRMDSRQSVFFFFFHGAQPRRKVRFKCRTFSLCLVAIRTDPTQSDRVLTRQRSEVSDADFHVCLTLDVTTSETSRLHLHTVKPVANQIFLFSFFIYYYLLVVRKRDTFLLVWY